MGSPPREPDATLPGIGRREKEAISGDDPEPMAVHPRRRPYIPIAHHLPLHLEMLLQEGGDEACTRQEE